MTEGEEKVLPSPVTCDGCLLKGRCLPYGTRTIQRNISVYCDINGNWEPQKIEGKNCQNNYECISNYCIDGKCISSQKQWKEQKTLLQMLVNLLRRFLSIFGISLQPPEQIELLKSYILDFLFLPNFFNF